MLVIIGAVVVIVTVMGGYIGNGGEIGVLIQPFEILIIIGAAAGGFLIANPDGCWARPSNPSAC